MVTRVLLIENTEMVLESAYARGKVYRYLFKPWDDRQHTQP